MVRHTAFSLVKAIQLVVVASSIAAQHAYSTPTPTYDHLDGDDNDVYNDTETPTQFCDEASPFYRSLNGLAIAQSAVGGVGVLLCIVAAMHVYGYGRAKRSLATRLVLGMLLGNLVYAATDVVPTHLAHLSGRRCASWLIGGGLADATASCLPDAVMFFGVWSTTMYELMMVLVSTHALLTGNGSIPLRETCLHLLCIGAGAAGMLSYYFRCRDLNLEIYDIIYTDDPRLNQLWEAYYGLPGLLWGWALGPVALAFLFWVRQRFLYRTLIKQWDEATARNQAFDYADGLLDPGSDTRARLLELRKQAYDELVQPLGPYVIAIFLFAIPQAVIVTDACVDETQAALIRGYSGSTTLPCEFIVEFVLAFRAPVLAAVYLLPNPKTRSEAFDVLELCRKVWARGICSACIGVGSGQVRFPANELNEVTLVKTEGEGRSTSFGNADDDIFRMGTMASRTLTELDVAAANRTEADEDPNEGGGATDPTDSLIPYQLMG